MQVRYAFPSTMYRTYSAFWCWLCLFLNIMGVCAPSKSAFDDIFVGFRLARKRVILGHTFFVKLLAPLKAPLRSVLKRRLSTWSHSSFEFGSHSSAGCTLFGSRHRVYSSNAHLWIWIHSNVAAISTTGFPTHPFSDSLLIASSLRAFGVLLSVLSVVCV